MTAEQQRYRGVQAGIAGARVAAQRAYYQQMWPLQDQAAQLGYVQQMGGVSEYGQNVYTGAFAFQQMQGQMGLRYGLAGIGLSREQLGMQREFAERDYRFAMETAGIQYGRGLTQRGWTREDWALQQGQMQREFGWRMEDYGEAIRFATGRERQTLIRRQERDVVRFAEDRARFETMKERREEQWRWQDEDHERQMRRLAERRQRTEDLSDLQERRLNLQEQRLLESHDLQMRQLEERKQAYEENFQLQEDQRDVTREYQEKTLELAEAAAGAAKKHAEEMDRLQEKYRGIQRAQQLMASEWQRVMVEALIAIARELGADVGSLMPYRDGTRGGVQSE
jgi:hypothetical protein